MSTVVVGGGHAAGQLSASLRQLGYEDPITVLTEENALPYQRPPLSKQYLKGEFDLDRVELRPLQFYESRNIAVHRGERVTELDVVAKRVICANNASYEYDNLVLATGSSAVDLDLPGRVGNGIHLLRTIADVDAIMGELKGAQSIAIVGGGYIGLEVAATLSECGHTVTVVELEDRVLKRVATPEMSTFFEQLHAERGVEIHTNARVEEFLQDAAGRVSGLKCHDNLTVDADLVVIGIGIKPNEELAVDAGLTVDDGICVDEYCHTGAEGIYAIGDCTKHLNALIEHPVRLECVPNAMEQARIAALHITGTATQHAVYPWFWSDQFDVKFQMAGFGSTYDEVVTRGDSGSRRFAKFYLTAGRLTATDAVNMPREFLAARKLLGSTVDSKSLADSGVDLKSLL